MHAFVAVPPAWRLGNVRSSLISSSCRKRPRRRQVPCAKEWSFDHVPDWVRELDKEEVIRRSTEEPMPDLPPDVLEDLHREYPQLVEIDRMFERLEAAADKDSSFDQNSPTPYSWLYLQERPWIPNKPFILVCSAAFIWCLRKAWLTLHRRYSPSVIAKTALHISLVSGLSLALLLPLFLIYIARRNRTGNEDAHDPVVRTCTMVAATGAGLTVPTLLYASIGAIQSALIVDILSKGIALPYACWGWADLRDDVEKFGTTSISTIFRVWRLATTSMLCIFGTLMSAISLNFPSTLPLGAELAALVTPVRQYLGERFPVALSLARDSGGLHFLAFLWMGVFVLNILHVLIVATDFGSIKSHRRSRTVLTTFFESRGMYEDVNSWVLRNRGPGTFTGPGSYRPSQTMLLLPHESESLFGNVGALIQDEHRPAVFQLLEDEEKLAEDKGVESWIKDRNEWVSSDRNDDLLQYWAKPLTESQQKKPISDYFDLLEESEFEYDPDMDEWVFTDLDGKVASNSSEPAKDKGEEESVFI